MGNSQTQFQDPGGARGLSLVCKPVSWATVIAQFQKNVFFYNFILGRGFYIAAHQQNTVPLMVSYFMAQNQFVSLIIQLGSLFSYN